MTEEVPQSNADGVSQDAKSISDADLQALLAMDIDRYFPLLIEKYADSLYRFATYKGVVGRENAEDVVQQALMNAYTALRNHAGGYILSMNLRSWLYTIIRHESYKFINKYSSRYVSISLD